MGGPSSDGGDGPYSASKGAVRSLTKHAAHLLAKDNIRVNSVHPGGIRTPMSEKAIEENPSIMERMREFSPLPLHMGEPEDIGYGVIYLASDESRFTTGAEMVIDGGGISH
ncbi:hypothetical protein GCM10028868_39030 [Virgibacillus kimchii]